MSTAAYVREALAPFSTFVERQGVVAVSTACLYPSNAAVTVFVRGGRNGAVVSDDGRAIDELTTYNREIPEPDKFLARFCRRSGLKAENGKIRSPRVEGDQLASSIAFVANASSAAVAWGLDHLKLRRRRNLRAELEKFLANSFPSTHIDKDRRIEGKSTRTYRFNTVIRLNHDHLLVIDPVTPDPNSINSHAIAHLDISHRHDPNIVQRIVYDEEDDWKAADLNLLQMATTLVPFSHLGDVLHRIGLEQ